MLSKKQLFTRGMLDISPHMLSVIPFGIICGAIGVELGFHPYLVYAMSFIIFGGASQIVFLQLLSGGASSLVAVASVGIINSRHLLYGAVLSQYLDEYAETGQQYVKTIQKIIEQNDLKDFDNAKLLPSSLELESLIYLLAIIN